MIYSPTAQKSQQRMLQNASNKIARPHFLVVGYSSDTKGDDTVGIQLANHVSAWQVPSVESITVCQLTADLVNRLASVDYAFFVSPCQRASHARTLQIDPISASIDPLQNEQSSARSHSEGTRPYTPLRLLSLAKQLYGRAPQAWRLQIPIVSNKDDHQGLSATTQRGYDRALRTIEQFFITYQQPARMS